MTTRLNIDAMVFEGVPKLTELPAKPKPQNKQIVAEMEAIIADLEKQKQKTNEIRNKVILLMSKIEGGRL